MISRKSLPSACGRPVFLEMKAFYNTLGDALIAVALYGQAKVKTMKKWNEQGKYVRRNHNSGSCKADPWTWKPFLFFGPIFPEVGSRNTSPERRTAPKGPPGKWGRDPLTLILWEIPGLGILLRNAAQKKLFIFVRQSYLTTGNSFNIPWKHYRLPKQAVYWFVWFF